MHIVSKSIIASESRKLNVSAQALMPRHLLNLHHDHVLNNCVLRHQSVMSTSMMASGHMLLCCIFIVARAQDMAWVGGNRLANKLPIANVPGGRSGMAVWQDSNSTVWMFGGIGVSSMATATGGPAMLNDVWRFTNGNLSWQQVHPGTVSNLTVATSRLPQIPRPRQLSAVCGTGHVMVLFGGLTDDDLALGDLWVFDDSKKVWRKLADSYNGGSANETQEEMERDIGPEPRGDSALWCTSDHLYIFGGVNGSNHIFSDMWRISLQDFMWEEVPSSKEAPASLRDRKTADYPDGRNGAMTWTDQSAPQSEATLSLFLFGGNVLSKHARNHHFASGYTSDMWQYSIAKDKWTYLTGNTHPGQPGYYGQVREMNRASFPGCRRGAATWTDAKNMLWLFGGEGADSVMPSDVHPAKLLSDQWRFHPLEGQWEWMGGSSKGDTPAVFKQKGQLMHAALAGGRLGAAAWKDGEGQLLYFFGGRGHDAVQLDGLLSDLWLLDISNTISYHFYVPAVYGFAVIFIGVALLLCLCVVALYGRDRRKPSQWQRERAAGTRYSQLHDSDT